MANVKVRFAPSPTGDLHIGGARTALFNWLWARKNGGTFVLRVEDTDQERNKTESASKILDALRWLKLDWDEGPTYQSDRFELFQDLARLLVSQGYAYACACTDSTNKHQCPNRDSTKISIAGPYVIRLKAPTSEMVWTDLVWGDMHTPAYQIEDFVLIRSNGVATYNFACAVDDAAMGITHVIRGADHLINTPKQLALHQALGTKTPQYAHLPIIMANKHEKLSKRHGTTGVLAFRERGYCAEGLLSYLARFGWSDGDREIWSREELTKAFDLSHIKRGDGIFDKQKCLAINTRWVRQKMTISEAIEEVAPWVTTSEWLQDRYQEAVGLLLPRLASTNPEIGPLQVLAQELVPYHQLYPQYADDIDKKYFTTKNAKFYQNILSELKSPIAMDAWFQAQHAVSDWELVRVALTGKTHSPPLQEVVKALGPDRVFTRLAYAYAKCKIST